MDIVIRYIFKHRATGNIEIKIYSISQLEERPAQKLSPCFNETDYELIARNLCFDEEKGVFVGDVINVTTWFGNYIASVKLGEYEQDGSGDEYEPSKCFGFYAEALNKKITDEDGFEVVPEYLVQNSMLELESYKRIGNIYQNPHLLKEEAR
ncbi:hypothetical protein BSA171_14540 [Bacillus safensis]|uniref:hypothetical protein n=1 Tax=Bacillus safensis TaxID=561879 RepID=UPI00094BD34B|nr:hypothetical protein [Bacillus safensis]APT48985.1 hypothetical protein BSA41_03175 [Bacillus safensis]APT54739.1 hypothetical protein BSA171_14540 [Bacillus safensis]